MLELERFDEEPRKLRIPEPWTMAGLREMPDHEERWLVEGWSPEDANVLWAGYPKTYKTMLLQELALAMATATPFLGRFQVPQRRRVGLILMEDARHRARRRYERIAQARGISLWDRASGVDGIFTWFRPPLRLSSAADMQDLAAHVEDRKLEYLHIDSWAYVATGNSNDADEVTPQLQALSGLRERFPGLTVGLTHHARKTTQDRGGDRLTDLIRNSSAFGAWYDVGVVLSRADELSPVKVRSEMRDFPAPDPFVFTVEDQIPAGPDSVRPDGWLKIEAVKGSAAMAEREDAWRRLLGPLREFLTANPGASKRQMRDGIEARNSDIDLAFAWLESTGEVRYDAPEKRGQAGECHLISPTVPDRAPTVPGAHPGGTVPDRAPGALKGPGSGHTPTTSDTAQQTGHGSAPGFTCTAGCGNTVGGPKVTCVKCRNRAGEGEATP